LVESRIWTEPGFLVLETTHGAVRCSSRRLAGIDGMSGFRECVPLGGGDFFPHATKRRLPSLANAWKFLKIEIGLLRRRSIGFVFYFGGALLSCASGLIYAL